MYIVCPHRSQQNCTTYNCSSCQYQNDSQVLNLQLHAELEHFDEDNFGIVFTWNQLPGDFTWEPCTVQKEPFEHVAS